MTTLRLNPSANGHYAVAPEHAERVRTNQARLTSTLRPSYDFIVCGSGSSGSVVARRLAENPDVSVLLVEAGDTDDVASVVDPGGWPFAIGSDLDWGFHGEPNPHMNGRSVPFSMGKVLGGGSSINVMVWARGHKSDWDHFATETSDPAWNYESVLAIYRRMEDWHGTLDPKYRGTGGPVYVQPAPNPNPIALATVEGARQAGMPTFENPNGRLMESPRGASIIDVRIRNDQRESSFRSYVYPWMDRPNLTVLTRALVTRLTFSGRRATGVEISHAGRVRRISAGYEVVLSLGAIHTPKVLMQSGVGDEAELRRFDIPVVQHLPGVGANLQDHVAVNSVWEYKQAMPPRNNFSEAMFFATSKPELESPDIFACQAEVPMASPEIAARFPLPTAGFTIFGSLTHPRSRGHVRLSGSAPHDPVRIEANTLSDPDDVKTAKACIQLCREVGNSEALRTYVRREVLPGKLQGADLEDFVRNAATTFWHSTCSAKMGRDAMSVVDGKLRVYGVENLRIADGSIMPRITSANTMAPCMVIGERAAEELKARYRA
jgi:choline dehydrogenase-like flavoprotein